MGFGSALAAIALMAFAPGAGAQSFSERVTATDSSDRSCTGALRDDAAVAKHTITAPAAGSIRARLSDASGDWDLGVFDAATGETVAGSAQAGSRELAEGFVLARERLVVQACRLEGAGSAAGLDVDFARVDTTGAQTIALARVSTPTADSVGRLQALGLDHTEHGGEGFVDVVLHGADDGVTLTTAGFEYTPLVEDLTAQSLRQRRADAAYASSHETSGLPSGGTTYRRLFDYSEQMKRLAREHPDLVDHFTLPKLTWEGRPVEGIEISQNVDSQSDGKPVFLQMGAHHAREWPSAEHAMEWAYELIIGQREGDPRVRELMASTRTIVVPVVNPDGFNTSREAGELLGAGNGRGGDGTQETINIVTSPYEYRRKNCRLVTDAEAGNCLQPSVGLAEPGVDPNRNYGGFWGGPGASTDPTAQDYRGPGPFSEPETQNIRRLVSSEQVTTLITNHTYSNLVLRPPGLQEQGEPVDEPIYKALGDAMAAENGYTSQPSYALYDTSGTTEDWSYYATGGLGFTFEIGPNNFHPPFEQTVAEYEGTTGAAGPGGGNREAYFLAQENTADRSKHSVLAGRAPAGAQLTLSKSFRTPTYNEEHGTVRDRLETDLVVSDSGRFAWHINPSTRPLVAQESGREATGDPSPAQEFSGSPAGPPEDGAQPCADFDTEDDACFNDHPFTVPAGPGIDNAKATIRIDWTTPASDWDMKVYRDSNGDGSSAGEGQPIGSSGQGTTSFEETTLSEPLLEPGGDYVVRVINWGAAEPYTGQITFAGPDPFQPAQTESWTLTCATGGGVQHTGFVVIDRGQRQTIDLRRPCRA
ncbi:MAG: M14 family zinc carboxypeptidase [Solirubrobacterales bacterium]